MAVTDSVVKNSGNSKSVPRAGLGARANLCAAVRHRLIAAAHELFDEFGFDACTTTDIAARAEVSQRTFFRYFPVKEDVMLHWLDSYNATVCDRLRRRPPAETTWKALRRAFDPFCHLSASDAARVRLIRRMASDSITLRSALLNKQSEWEQQIAAVLSEREHRNANADYQAKFLAGFAMSALVTAFREADRVEGDSSVEDMMDFGFAILQEPGKS